MHEKALFRILTLLMTVTIAALAIGCGNDDDDDDGGQSLESLADDAHSALSNAEDAFWGRICECAKEEGMMQEGDDCGILRDDGDFSDDFNPSKITQCDQQVFDHYESELTKALKCLKTSVAPALNDIAGESCAVLFGDEEGDDPVEDAMESCYPGFDAWSDQMDAWIKAEGLDTCTGLFTPDED